MLSRIRTRLNRSTVGAYLGAIGVVLTLELLAPVSAGAVTLGPTKLEPTGSSACATSCTALNESAPVAVQLTAPFTGVISRWRVVGQGSAALQVVRNVSPLQFSFQREGPLESLPGPAALHTFPVRIPIASGSQIAVKVVAGSTSFTDGATGWRRVERRPAFPAPPTTQSNFSDSLADVNADIEPDADGDGFGDESQDRCLGQAGSDRGCRLSTPGGGGGGGDTPKAPKCAGRRATIIGTPGKDRLKGTRRRDVIVSLGGNDSIRAGRGSDIVCAGSGNDKASGGSGNDRIYGERGKDRLSGDAGNDRLLGGSGRDRLLGGRGRDRLIGGPGRDRLRGGPGRDRQRQ